jgi:Ca2+-binding RTX toxin-like protein
LGGDGNDQIYLSDFQGGNDTGGDTVSGGNGNDTVYGTSAADRLFGDADSDYLHGYAGNDSLDGSTGNDTLFGGQGVDTLLGGDGNDFITLSDFDNSTDTGGDSVRGGNGDDRIFGTSVADRLLGDADNDSLEGGSGNDTLEGSTGNDTLSGEEGDDSLLGSDGNDVLDGGNGNDILRADAGNDTITGGAGNDTLSAGTMVNGGVANTVYYDRLTGDTSFSNGDTGADTFVFEAPTTANKAIEFVPSSGQFFFNAGAIIADFSIASDTIRLAGSMVGDGDNLLELVEVKETAGGTFDKDAEMVIFRADSTAQMSLAFNVGVLTAFNAAAVTTVIDDADASFAIGDKRLFVIDDGNASAVFQFVSANADAVVTVDELFLISVVDAYSVAVTALTSADFVLG